MALENDPDLVAIPTDILPFIIQKIYVCTGCDYISFFSQIGKATFLRYFFQYASFITSGNPEGTLADTVLEENIFETGYLAFLRLVGTVYFKKYATAFEMQSPATHFIQFCTATHSIRQQHTAWLEDIRNNIWDRITFENEMMPSDDALYLHWGRSCWVLHMWRQANLNNMSLKPITDCGWQLVGNTLTVVWDTPKNIASICNRVRLLLRGCKCVTGCTTGRCGCKKSLRKCSEGCQCRNCLNTSSALTSESELLDIVIEEDMPPGSEHTEEETDELMDWIFGNEGGDPEQVEQEDYKDHEEYDSS